jgi:hypothetical protein
MAVSICIQIKNRSRIDVANRWLNLFPRCIDAILEATKAIRIPTEMVIADWASVDWPLSEWLPQRAKSVAVRILQMHGELNRGMGRNIAAKHAQSSILFFIDADMLVCAEVLKRGVEVVQSGGSYFPICYSFNDPEHRTGCWRTSGYGNCAVSRAHFEKVRWPEYAQWGKEDDHFYKRMCELGPMVREKVPGFYHQWHPNDLAWKDRYVNPKA